MRFAAQCLILAAFLSMGIPGVFVHAQRPAETAAEVPALNSFHDVIFKIWHEAWPQKNAALLRQLVPEVAKGIASVAAAPLPGILRDKKASWDEGVRKLQNIGSEYQSAASSGDDTRLLAVAEGLHSQFEALMRITRPAMKELDEFHAVLYMLYHHYLPQREMDKVKGSAVELTQKMTALNAATPPARLKEKRQEFSAARAELSKAVVGFRDAVGSNAKKTVEDAVEAVHSAYQKLDRLFE